jgi:N4-gp56 family major capsid protein
MAVDTFIPEVWNANLITAINKTLVLGDAVNTNYEGDIAEAGDTVHVGTIADPTIRDYVKNVTVINPDTLSTTDQTLVIDQSKYYAIEVDDVDKRQAKAGGALLKQGAARAAYQLKKTTDTFLGARMVAGAGTVLAPSIVDTTAAGAAGESAAYLKILQIKKALDNLDIPTEGRFIAAEPNFINALALDKRFTDASQYGSSRLITNGEVGTILGFAIKLSTNLPAGTVQSTIQGTFILAGTSQGMTFAQQISKTEAYRPESSFGDAIKGLHLYGGKVIEPAYLVAADTAVK